MTNCKLLQHILFLHSKGTLLASQLHLNTTQIEFLTQALGTGVANLKQLKDGTKPAFSIKRH